MPFGSGMLLSFQGIISLFNLIPYMELTFVNISGRNPEAVAT